jgi:hypothetical protein
MRISSTIVLLVTSLSLAQIARAAPFGNLNFEDSPVPPGAPESDSTPTTPLFPSWTLRFGETVQKTAFLNEIQLGGDTAALVASVTPNPFLIEGTDSVYLGANFNSPGVSLGQVGDVPAGTRSIRLLARNPWSSTLPSPPEPLDLRMDGVSVPLFPLWSATDGQVLDIIYGGDITAWAGTSAELRIVVLSEPAPRFGGFAGLDSFSFSPKPVPEPGAAWLIALVGAMLVRSRR